VEHEDFTAQARDAFWRMMGEGSARVVTPVQPKAGIHVEPREGGQAYFSLGIPAPCYSSAQRYNLHLLTRILGGGVSSRLFRVLRETGLAYDASAEYEAYREGGLLTIEGSTGVEDLAQTLQLAMDCATDLLTGTVPPDEDELVRTQTHLRAQHLIASQDVHTRMSRLGTQQLYFGRSIDDGEVVDAIEKATLDSLMSTAAALDLAESFLVLAGPEESIHVAESVMKSRLWSAASAAIHS
jgi:predicted Zn-dependent peptidase